MTISPGVYRIMNAKTHTIFDLCTSTRTKIQGWQQHDKANQRWFVQSAGEGVVLKNYEAGKYVYTTSTQNGSPLLGSGNFTVWNLTLQPNGSEWIISVPGTNYVIDLDYAKADNGTTILLWVNNGGRHQKWIFEKISDEQPEQLQKEGRVNPLQDYQVPQQQLQQIHRQLGPLPVFPGTYYLRNVMSGTLVSLYSGSVDEGAEVSGYGNAGGNHQKWQLQPTGYDSTVTLRNVQTNTYLSFQSKSFVPSVSVKSSYYPQDYISSAADRGFYISPAQQPSHALSLFHGSAEDRTEIGIWHNEQQDNQKWYFDRTLYEVQIQKQTFSANPVDQEHSDRRTFVFLNAS